MTGGRWSRLLALALAAACLPAVLATGCGGEGSGDKAAVNEGTYVGRVSGSDAYIALVSNGKRLVTGYVCDGKDVARWLRPSPISDGSIALRARNGDPLGTATFDGKGASGEITLDGARHRLSAEIAVGRAGLYRAATGRPGRRGSTESGWVVLADGSLRGARTSFIDPNSQPVVSSAPALAGTRLTTSFIDPTAQP